MKVDPLALQRNARRASRLLKTLASDHRLMILCHLAGGERSVGDLQKLLRLGQSALSQHLARLRRDGVVATRREAQTIFYALADADAIALMKVLYRRFCGPRARLP